MSSSEVGFAVIYRWRLRSGREEDFREGWESMTRSLRKERGALGSRLHRAEDGTWFAYAQWPTRLAWQRSRELGSADPAASAAMERAIAASYDPILLEPVCDHLVSG